jgi:hypothetical protein
MFQFSRFAPHCWGLRGCPIRKSPDQRSFAAPRSLSQLYTSFIASLCLGIHHVLLLSFFSEQAPHATPLLVVAPRAAPRLHSCVTTHQPRPINHGKPWPIERSNHVVTLLFFSTTETSICQRTKQQNLSSQHSITRITTTSQFQISRGASRSRTDDLLLARQAL